MKLNIPFIAVLSGVWLILLSLCALIGYLIVPVGITVKFEFLRFLISIGKVVISLLAIFLWLLAWYKAMDLILNVEFYLAERNDLNPKDN